MKFSFNKIITLVFLSLIIASCGGSKKVPKKTEEVNADVKKEEEEVKNEMAFDFMKADLLSEVLERAKKENKWIYIDLGAKWCIPCQMMKQEVYTDKNVADFFNENFITYLVDVQKGEGPDLKLIYNVSAYPTLLFVNENGREMLRIENSLSQSRLLSFGKDALDKKKSGN